MFFLGKFPQHDHKKEIDIELYVWNHNNEMYYIYTPGSNINFVTDQQAQSLTVALKAPPTQQNRFKIHSYSIRDRSMCHQASYFDAVDNEIALPVADGHLFKANPTKVKFNLKLTGVGTYITLNVIDITNNWILSCDPQVENGTKT